MKPQPNAGLFAATLGVATFLCASAMAEPAATPQAAKTETKTEVKSDAKNAPAPLPAITAAPGSPEEVAQLRALVEALTSRLQGVEVAQKKTDETVSKNAPTASSSSKLPITVSGLLQVHGIGTTSEDGPDAFNQDTFRIRRGELKVAGKITPRISASAMIDIAKVQDGNDRASDTLLQEVILTYLLNENKARGTSHSIDVGQFKVPIGYEGDQVSSSALQTIERALMFGNRDPFRGGYGDKRETGVRLRGTMGQFQYDLGVFNGLGERQNTTATRDNKAVVARLGFRPRSIKGLLVGVSAAKGDTGNTTSAADRLDRDILNGFLAYVRNKVTVQAEYTKGDASTINGASIQDIRSYYGSLGYRFTNKLEGVVRYDVFDFTRSGSGGDINEATLGVNYYIKGNNAKIQANLVKRNGDFLAPGGFRNDSTQFRTNFQVAF